MVILRKYRCLISPLLSIMLLTSVTSCRSTNQNPQSETESIGEISSANPMDPAYEKLGACQKQMFLWQKVVKTKYATLPDWKGTEPLQIIADKATPVPARTKAFYEVTMSLKSDEMPAGRSKRIHSFGSVAKIKFVADPRSPYTGLFKGVDCGLVRTSMAIKPPADNPTPGLAIKFLIDGQPSDNFMAMYSLDGQKNHNFFENNFSNEIAPPTHLPVQILSSVFSRVANHPNRVDVNYMADVTKNGTPVESPWGPLKLELRPNKAALARYIPVNNALHEVREDFAKIPARTVLYYVYAVQQPTPTNAQPALSAGGLLIGTIITDSEFVSSEYGDSTLFFRHQLYTGDKDGV